MVLLLFRIVFLIFIFACSNVYAFDKVRAYNNANISIANNVTTDLTFNSERFDSNNLHDTVTNTGRLTASLSRKYLVICNVEWAANATGYRSLIVRKNGVTIFSDHNDVGLSSATFGSAQAVVGIIDLVNTDYVVCTVLQNSGAALNVLVSGNYSPEFMMVELPDTMFVLSGISARAYNNAEQTITTNTETILNYNSERWDSGTIHDISSNTSRLTVTTTGLHLIISQDNFLGEVSPVGYRKIAILKNGTTVIGLERRIAIGDDNYFAVSTLDNSNANDYYETQVRHNQGANTTVGFGGANEAGIELMIINLETGTSGGGGFNWIIKPYGTRFFNKPLN